MYGLATVFDWMGQGHAQAAEALVRLPAGGQSSIDGGRWALAWMFTHLPDPPAARNENRRFDNPLRPRTRLLSATWVAAAAAAYTRAMSVLQELKKKAAPPEGAYAKGPKKGGGEPKRGGAAPAAA